MSSFDPGHFKKRNLVLGLVLAGLCALFYGLSIVKF